MKRGTMTMLAVAAGVCVVGYAVGRKSATAPAASTPTATASTPAAPTSTGPAISGNTAFDWLDALAPPRGYWVNQP